MRLSGGNPFKTCANPQAHNLFTQPSKPLSERNGLNISRFKLFGRISYSGINKDWEWRKFKRTFARTSRNNLRAPHMKIWGFEAKGARKFTRTSPRTLPWNVIAILSAPPKFASPHYLCSVSEHYTPFFLNVGNPWQLISVAVQWRLAFPATGPPDYGTDF